MKYLEIEISKTLSLSQHKNLTFKGLNDDGKAVTSKLYIMLNEHLLNLTFIPFMNPILTALFALKNQIQGKHCAYFRKKVCFCEIEILAKGFQMNKKLFYI